MVTIVGQVYIFLYAVLGGAIIAFLYDILRIKRRAIKTGVIIVNLEDIIFWLTSAVLMFVIIYATNNGELRGYIFLGTIIGVTLYLSILSKPIIASSMMVINIIKKFFRLVWKVVSYPFKLIYKVLSVPIRFVGRLIGKAAKGAAQKTGKFATDKAKKIHVWTKSHRRKKKKT